MFDIFGSADDEDEEDEEDVTERELDREEVLATVREKGLEAFFEYGDGSPSVIGREAVLRSLPTLYEVGEALREADGVEVRYNGRYTGPGRSTGQMYAEAGYEGFESLFFEDREPRTVRLRLRRQSRSPGPSKYRSFRVEEYQADNADGTPFEISCNRDAGTPDHMIIVEVDE